MEPSWKRVNMSELMDSLAKDMFGRTRTGAITANECVECGGPATDFRDELSQKEYTISGLCQSCQDKVWG